MAIMKNYVERFASYTTMHGFRRIVDSKATPKRLAWIIVFATAWMFFTIHTSVVLKSYFEYPIKTTTNIVSGGVPFPDITLCNLGSFDFYAVYRLSKGIGEALNREDDIIRFEDLIRHHSEAKMNDSIAPHDHKEDLQVIKRMWNYNYPINEEYLDEADFSLNDTFTRAMFKYYKLIRRSDLKKDSFWKAVYD